MKLRLTITFHLHPGPGNHQEDNSGANPNTFTR